MTRRVAPMLPLLRKDWRLYRAPVIASVIVLGIVYWCGWQAAGGMRYGEGDSSWHYALGSGAIYGFFATAVMAAVYAGVAFAAERRDRSADFLAMLPPTSGEILLSKLIVTGGCLAVMTAVNVAALWIAGSPNEGRVQLHFSFQHVLWPVAAGCMFFGVAWLFSTFLQSPTLAASLSCGITAFTLLLVRLLPDPLLLFAHVRLNGYVYCAAMAVIGVTTLAGGILYRLRRVEP